MSWKLIFIRDVANKQATHKKVPTAGLPDVVRGGVFAPQARCLCYAEESAPKLRRITLNYLNCFPFTSSYCLLQTPWYSPVAFGLIRGQVVAREGMNTATWMLTGFLLTASGETDNIPSPR